MSEHYVADDSGTLHVPDATRVRVYDVNGKVLISVKREKS